MSAFSFLTLSPRFSSAFFLLNYVASFSPNALHIFLTEYLWLFKQITKYFIRVVAYEQE